MLINLNFLKTFLSVINRIWEIERPVDCGTRILYSSSLLFSKRQYSQMDSKFSRLRLNFSLEVLLRNGIVHCQARSELSHRLFKFLIDFY